MARPVTTLVVFFVFFNLWAGLLMGTGAASELGVDTDVGGDEDFNETADQDIPSGDGIGETLFGLYNMLTRFLRNFVTLATAGVSMLGNAGVPSEYLKLMRLSFGILIVIDLVSFYKGWGL